MEYHGPLDIQQESPLLIPTGKLGLYSFVGEECWERTKMDNSRAHRSEEAMQANTEITHQCKIKIISSNIVHVKKRGWIDIAMANKVPTFL